MDRPVKPSGDTQLLRPLAFARRANRRHTCPAPSAKIILFSFCANHFHSRAIPSCLRGVSRSSRTLVRDAVDVSGALTKAPTRGRRSRVVLTPRRWRQVGGSNSASDGGKKARSPGRARNRPLKPLRGECRTFSGVTVVTNACAYYHCARGCGRAERPAFPAPSVFRGTLMATTRAHCAARMRGRGFSWLFEN
jgi:hypothetical protein